MSALTIFAAVAVAVGIILAVMVFSMRITDRKSNEDLKKRLPDASSVNAGGYVTPVGGD